MRPALVCIAMLASACALRGRRDDDERPNWLLHLRIEPQELPSSALGVPDDVTVAAGQLWVAVDDLPYPVVSARPGVLAILGPPPSHLGRLSLRFTRTVVPGQDYANFSLHVVASD